ncbi:MAG: hypothetical protein A2V21_303415 [Deltaproteobacteria bacterium GWC2_55_46]|nr:MAG: hypothetical protein A2Z79_12345 [Deltaproteobacteria bacterium GWA2_55_82]OGQ63960.1 MAG: hypothetical protein A3I81_07875 [Deltaproteobacteria bacterium RIFCSPLOWO2_02_FULL_55_12]OIJ73393.1 MAG: hypothetical protein A2V21_303415 [Deltaproteobacteria bacterium GWC2_55_46]
MIRAKILISALAFLIITASYAIAGGQHTGTVLETAEGGGYTYVKVKEKGEAFWIAGPQTKVGKGATVSFSEQVWMPNFRSNALNRTFDKVLFVSEIKVGSSKGAPAKKPSKKSKAAKAAKAYTIEQIYANASGLKGRVVKVSGKVVKVSENIMARTWVHIQDGTGEQGTNNLVFRTTDTPPAVGSAVTAQGTVDTDKDFGFGYFYAVIIEDATFSK